MTFSEAIQYIYYGIKKGFFPEDRFLDEKGNFKMTDEELKEFAEKHSEVDWDAYYGI